MKTTVECPNCFRTSIPRIKVHQLQDGDRIFVTESCGFCRFELSQRESTNEIERVRRDIRNLQSKVDKGDAHLAVVLQSRISRYKILLRQLNS